jgi:hypothetical protein
MPVPILQRPEEISMIPMLLLQKDLFLNINEDMHFD